MAASAETKTQKTTLLANDYSTKKPRLLTLDTHSEDLNEIHKEAPDIYILQQMFEFKTD